MSDQDNQNPPGVPLKKETLERFSSLADSTINRAGLLLADHFQDRLKFSSEVLSRVCELYASGTIFREFLDNRMDIEALPEGSTLEVPPSLIQAIAKIVLSLSACKEYLIASGISLDRENDV